MRHALAALLVGTITTLSTPAAFADAPAGSELDLVKRARAALGEVRAFEHLNADIIKRCQDPTVTGAYGDWREEFHDDLERAHALDKALQRRTPEATTAAPADDRLRQFTEVEGQALYSRCLRWSTLLIQRESPVRAGIASRFAFLKESESQLRAVLGNDSLWDQWRAAGTLP